MSRLPPAPDDLAAQFSLVGRSALVTGGTGYLGAALCAALAEAGAAVVVASRDEQRAAQAAAELPTDQGQQHHGVALDYTDEAAIAAGFHRAVELAGPIGILVNNGHLPEPRDWRTIDPSGFDSQMRHASGYFQLARFVRDAAVQQARPASVVMLGSMYGQVASYPAAYEGIGPANSVAYQCLKGGIAQMARHLAVYWAHDRVRVNTLSPGPFPNTDGASPELVERLAERTPLGRAGRPAELKGAIVFLCSDASSYVTGHNLVVDGGWTAW